MSRDGRGIGGDGGGGVKAWCGGAYETWSHCRTGRTVGLWWEILPLRRLAILSFWKKLGHNSSRSLRKKKMRRT